MSAGWTDSWAIVAVAVLSGFAIGADWGTTTTALRSGWMKETGPVARRIGVTASALVRMLVMAGAIAISSRVPAGWVILLAAVAESGWTFWVARRNVDRTWSSHRGRLRDGGIID